MKWECIKAGVMNLFRLLDCGDGISLSLDGKTSSSSLAQSGNTYAWISDI